jgi:hypothetical protein
MSHPTTGDSGNLGSSNIPFGRIKEADHLHNLETATFHLDMAEEDHLHNLDHQHYHLDLFIKEAVDTALEVAAEATKVDPHHIRWSTTLRIDHPNHLQTGRQSI